MAISSPEEYENSKCGERIRRYLKSPELTPSQREQLAGFKAEFCALVASFMQVSYSAPAKSALAECSAAFALVSRLCALVAAEE